jgi:hypothetical protein
MEKLFGQEKLFGKFTYARNVWALPVDHPRYQGVSRIGTVTNSHSYRGLPEAEESTIRDQARTIRPQAWTVHSLKTQKNLKVMGSVKCIFSALVDCQVCMAVPTVSALSDIRRQI